MLNMYRYFGHYFLNNIVFIAHLQEGVRGHMLALCHLQIWGYKGVLGVSPFPAH